MQRIIYEIYRDRAALETHERQAHIQRFVAERKACVLATNIIDLRLKYAKVAALATTPAAVSAPETQSPRALRALEPATKMPTFSPHGGGQYPAQGTGEYTDTGNGWSADTGNGRQAGSGYERPDRLDRLDRPAGSDGRSPRSYAQDWDQPSYQGGRYGGS